METQTLEKSAKATECCPPFNPLPWDEKIIFWENKQFIRDKVKTFFYMPISFGATMKRMMKKVDAAGVETTHNLLLSDHTSKWNMDVYLEVDRPVPDATNVTLSGKYFSKVYEGPFRDTQKWTVDYEEAVKSKGLSIKKWYMWYTTCPKCAKKYGKNYTVIISEIEAL